jgi:Flp pilus assembly protein TadG
MQANRWMRRLLKSERGNVLVIGAATMPLLIGSAALAVDTIQMGLWKRQLQRAADSAALAGAYAIVQSGDATAAVNRDLEINNDVPLTGGPSVTTPSSGTYAGNPNAVQVQLTSTRTMPFMSFFNSTPPTITVKATASLVYQGEYCMVALEDGTVVGVTFTGSARLDLDCGVISNSRAARAVEASGSSQVDATPIAAVGGVPSSTNYIGDTVLLPFSSKQDDPFAGLPRQPSPPSNCQDVSISGQPNDPEIVVSPSPNTGNQFCLRGGADIKGKVQLAPGTYYVDGGTLSIGSQAVLKGSNVTIVLTSSTPTVASSFAGLKMDGGPTVNLTSPDSGTYKGVLFYQDPRSPYADSHFNGNASSSIEGGFYFPSRRLNFNGTAGLTTRCIQMVAKQLVFSGNASVQNICPETGGGKSFKATMVRLVA